MNTLREQRLRSRLNVLFWLALVVWTTCVAVSLVWCRAPRTAERVVFPWHDWAHVGVWLAGLTAMGLARRVLTQAIHARELASADLHREVMERRVVEERLREVNERYELVLAGSNTGIWDWDIRRDKVVFSSRWKTMRGFSEDEIGDSLEEWSTRIHPEDAPRVIAAVQAHFAGQTPSFTAEYRAQRKDGSWMWIMDHGIARRDSEGRVIRMAGSETDITEAKRTTDLVIESEARLSQALEAGKVFTFEWNPVTDEVLRSPNSRAVLGSIDESGRTLGKDFHAAVHAADREAFLRLISNLNPAQPSYSTNYRYCRPDDGREIVLEESARGEFDDAGRLISLRGLVRDITDRERAEATLRRGKELSEALNRVDRAVHATLETDPIMQRLISEGVAALGSDSGAVSQRRGGVWVISHVQGMPSELVGAHMDDDQERHAVLALSTGQVVAVRDAFNDERFHREHFRRHQIRSVLVAPLLVRRERVGALFFNYTAAPHDFTEAELDFARKLATTAAIALDNARLFAERTRAEALIRERESELKLVTDTVPALIAYIGADLRYRRVNRAYERWFGVAVQPIVGMPVREVLGEEVWGTIEPWLRKALAGQTVSFECQVSHPDGTRRWMTASYVPDQTENGEIRGVVAHILDITERRQTEEQLLRSSTELQAANALLRESRRAALNLMDDAFAARQAAEQASRELRERVVERERAEEALRRSHVRLDILACSASELLAAELPQVVVERLCRRVAEALDCQFFFNYLVDETSRRLKLNACAGVPPDEVPRLRWLDFGAAVCGCSAQEGRPIVAENILETTEPRTELVKSYGIRAYVCQPLIAQDEVIGTVSFGTSSRTRFTDEEVSLLKAVADQVAIALQRQQGEERLRRANAELEHRVAERTVQLATAARYSRSLLEAGIDALIVINPAGVITDVNQATEAVTGVSRIRLVGSLFPAHFTEPPRAQSVCEQVLARGTVRDYPLSIQHASGPITDVLLNATVYRNEAGEVQGVLVAARDLTERKAAERERQNLREELERVSRITTAGQLAAALAHELNQPLAAIACNVQAIENFLGWETPDFTEIKAALADIASDSHRAGAVIHQLRGLYQKTGGVRTEVPLNDVLRKTLDLLHSQLLLKEVTWRLELDPGSPVVRGNIVELQQVVLNLVTNALDAMTDLAPSSRRLLIRTTAAARPGQVQVSIRDAGTGIAPPQLLHLFEPFYTTKESGMGMGLAICRSIVEAHDGRLWAENNVERGATFHFILPVCSKNGS